MPSDIQGFVALGIMFSILGAPIWVPIALLVCRRFFVKSYWQFSLRFLLFLMGAECVALAISVAYYRLLTWLFENMPVPG